jgi:adenylosuccinate synthase
MGIRLCDLRRPEVLRDKLEANRRHKEAALAGAGIDWETLAAELLGAFARIEGQVGDASLRINALLDAGKRVLFEGAQGTLLDIDHGTYPYVTSSTPTAGGACVGAGVGPTRIDGVIGVTKAYTTRVGHGPFPTELSGPMGDRLVELGHEFGTTTGRRRRTGWLDAVMLRKSVQVNGLSSLAVTKLDVLDAFDEIKVAVAYEVEGRRVESFPGDPADLEDAAPVYETFPGWHAPTSAARAVDELPEAARAYLGRIAELAGVPVDLVSVGADRSTTIATVDPWACPHP